jgi:hypothetical protein
MSRLAAVALFTAVLSASAAHAASNYRCGTTSAGWNAPRGAAVFARDEGNTAFTTTVFDTVGEYRTHVMLSHGPNSSVTHATTKGAAQTTSCSKPLDTSDLQYGYPGASRVNQGGIYSFLYGYDESADKPNVTYLAFQRSVHFGQPTPAGAEVVGWLESYLSTSTVTSGKDSTQTLKRYYQANGTLINYSFHQFMDVESVHNSTAAATNNGMACSTFLAHLHYRAGKGVISPKAYSHTETYAATDALQDDIYDYCMDNMTYAGTGGLLLSCGIGPSTWCNYAGRQVRNCMVYNGCGDNDNGTYNTLKDTSTSYAKSISPDQLGGWNGTKQGIWSEDAGQTVQWNQGGATYGCWN